MSIQISSDAKEVVLFRGFVAASMGASKQIYVRPTQSNTLIAGTDYTPINFSVVSGADKVKISAVVRMSIPKGYTVDGLNFYDNASGTGNYFQIELENIVDKPEEIGDFVQQQGTYQINVLDIKM